MNVTPALAFILAGLTIGALAADAPAGLPRPRGRFLLRPFGYRGVTLGDGRLKTQYDEVRQWYLDVPKDDYLKDFRRYVGLPAPGQQLGGWYVDSGHAMPQVMSGLTRMYMSSGDQACREKVEALLTGWLACVRSDGSTVNCTTCYAYEKAATGLLDAYQYLGDRRALDLLSRITDWAAANFDRRRAYGDNGTEWYTLGENLYRAYLLTGDRKYLDFAEVWEYRAYWDLYATGGDVLARHPEAGMNPEWLHAFSHVNTLSSAAMAYRVKGDPYYLRVLEGAYDYFQANQVFATGSYGPWLEHLLPKDLIVAALTGDRHDSAETHCDAWAVFKLCKYLISFTGRARYGDWIERAVYNMVGAALPNTPDGHSFYYSDYNAAGGSKGRYPAAWTCCTGSRPTDVADYCDLIYFRGADALYVSLFVPSTVTWRQGGKAVTVTQETRFPDEEVTRLRVRASAPAVMGLWLRVPGWLAGPMSAQLNGRSVALEDDGRGWVGLRRQWRDGDCLAVRMPLGLWVSRIAPEISPLGAAMYGPVVLVARSPAGNPSAKADFGDLGRALVRSQGEPLTWRLAADPEVLFRPFYAMGEGEPYFMYLDTAAHKAAASLAATRPRRK